MNSPDWGRVREVFDAVVDLDPVERQRRIDAEAFDPAATRLLEALLAADRTERLADHAAAHVRRSVDAMANDELIGSAVGPWRIDALIGAGGMGRVYRAHREDGRYVGQAAIKFVTETADARIFAHERQMLALLSHPGIARLLDAGEDAGGRPYLVMEYVAGRRLDDYCRAEQTDARRCITLIADAAQAIAYAHAQMVLHRDIKPANLLVDAAGQVKVLDFGVAKLLDRASPDPQLTSARYFTLRYAAPEQIAGETATVAIDIFALAIVLFELLTAEHPFAADPVSQRSQVERVLAGEATPLRRFRKRDRSGALGQFSADRVRDLEAVLGKALARDPLARYASANEFADELRRVLADRPVLVRVPSLPAQLWRLARQHRLAVALAVAALAAVFVLTGIALWQAQVAQQQARVAEQRAGELEQVSKFQVDMLGQLNPAEAGKLLTSDVVDLFAKALGNSGSGDADRKAQLQAFSDQWQHVNATDAARNLIDRTIIKPAAVAIDARFPDQPLVAAALRQRLAELYRNIGLVESALPLQAQALSVHRRELGAEHLKTLESIAIQGVLLRDLGKLSEAEPYYLEAMLTSRRVLGDADAFTLVSTSNMGVLRKAQGRWDEAEQLYRDALGMSRTILGAEHPDTLALLTNLGILLREQGQLDAAEPLLREALMARRRVLGEEHASTLQSINNFAVLLRDQGAFGEAEVLTRETLTVQRRTLGDEHPQTLMSITNLGMLLLLQGKLDAAEPLLQAALRGRSRVLGAEHANTLNSLGNLGELLLAQGKHAAAVELLAPATATMRKVFTGENATLLAKRLIILGKARAALGAYPAAAESLLEAHAVLSQMTTPKPAEVRACVDALASLYAAWQSAEPNPGIAAKALEWQQRLDALAPASAAQQP